MMYHDLRKVILCFLLLCTIESCQKGKETQKTTLHLLPAPQKIVQRNGISLNPENVKTIYLYSNANKNDRFAAEILKNKIHKLYHHDVNVQVVQSYKNLTRPAIVLGIPSAAQKFNTFCSGLNLPNPKKNTKQSYVLGISKNLVTISGGGNSGLFYGVQTFNQLLEDAKWNNKSLHGMLIQDWPDIKMRAVHFDERHHLDRYSYMKKNIAKLAEYKVNAIFFEFADKFKYQKYPVIAAPNSFSPEQVKNLTEYAHKYHIDIIPLVEGLGHAGYILKHKQFDNLRAYSKSNWAFNPLKKGTYKLLFDLYHETMEATPGVKYFNVGGDEVRFTGKNKQLQEYKKKHGNMSLYLRWLNKVNAYIKSQGHTMIFWDDMPLKKAGLWRLTHQNNIPKQKFDSLWASGVSKLDSVIDEFPRNAIYTQWTYGPANRGNVRIINWYKKHGFKEISATAAQRTRPLIPNYDLIPANVKSFVSLSARKHVMGEVCTAWDDSGLNTETFWSGYLASADYGWSSQSPKTINEFWHKYIYRFFGPNTNGLDHAFHDLSKRVHFWDTGIMKKGRKYLVTRQQDQLISLPSLQNTPKDGSWSAHFSKLMQSAQNEQTKCEQDIKVLEKNMSRVKKNKYNLEVFASMGRFMKADAAFVLSIGKIAKYCDQAQKAYKQGEKKKVFASLNTMAKIADSAINNYKASFDSLRNLWQETRYPKGGKGFLPNRFFHFASQREDLSYLIMPEEKLDLTGYAKKLRKEAMRYKKQGNL
ncbi:MAG TPA: family 20 glycosylhydrolase [Balneolales bacterium]|nr:family 20 glycosylhydrolase [Balneolales bacterium]